MTAIGFDRPGIVAAVTKVLLEVGCNLEDTAMSILRGQFAMVLVVAAPDSLDAAALEAAVGDGTSSFDLVLAVRELHDTHESAASFDSWTVTVHGADRPGIVHGVTAALADMGANVLDLTTRVSEGETSIYSMVVEVELPDGLDGDALERAMEAIAGELGVVCTVHSSDADIL